MRTFHSYSRSAHTLAGLVLEALHWAKMVELFPGPLSESRLRESLWFLTPSALEELRGLS